MAKSRPDPIRDAFDPIRDALVLAGRPAGHQLALMPGGFVRFAIPQGGLVAPWVDSTSLLPLDTWTHVVGSYDATTGELKMYLNGVLEQTVLASGPMDSQPTTPFQIGGFQHPPFIGGFFQGQIDEVHLYDRALTAAEVQARTCLEPPAPPGPAVQYAYDALSRRTSLMLPNGTQTTYTYDPASQVTNILHKITATSAQINKADYVYNNVGNRTSLTDRRGAQAFGYDNLDRLTSATHPLTLNQSFSYDAVGNRLNNASQHNAGNQLTEDAGFTYIYDANGNLTRKTIKTNGNHTDYTYDAENRLVKVEEFAAGATTPAATSTYRYDGLGRRIEKVGNGLTRRYVYDGEDILLEYDETNTLLARYTHGPGIDEPIAMTRGGSTFFYHQDGLGSVTDLTDATASTVKAYAYDAWGNQVETTGTLENPYTYTGREVDQETGLYYYRARYYDPIIGRFILEDPAGFVDGPNIYSYVRNNPLNNKDPLGLTCGCTRLRLEEIRIECHEKLAGYSDINRQYTHIGACAEYQYRYTNFIRSIEGSMSCGTQSCARQWVLQTQSLCGQRVHEDSTVKAIFDACQKKVLDCIEKGGIENGTP